MCVLCGRDPHEESFLSVCLFAGVSCVVEIFGVCWECMAGVFRVCCRCIVGCVWGVLQECIKCARVCIHVCERLHIWVSAHTHAKLRYVSEHTDDEDDRAQ